MTGEICDDTIHWVRIIYDDLSLLCCSLSIASPMFNRLVFDDRRAVMVVISISSLTISRSIILANVNIPAVDGIRTLNWNIW